LLETIDNGILASYRFSEFQTVVGVGIPGSYGDLLKRILQTNSSLQGIFFDLMPGLKVAEKHLASVIDRCTLIEGDVLRSLPPDGDVYILKNLIHDWDDQIASQILNNCRVALHPQAKLLVVEMIIPPGNLPALGKILDIEALLMTTGGYERTEAQYRSLFAAAGLTVTNVIPTGSPFSIIEAVLS
ncbi:MAG TPA: methyltransferase, partial [Allocoleopsis sp.]